MHELEELHQSSTRSTARYRCFTNLIKKNEDACERGLYSTTFNLKYNSLLLVTTVVDPRYRISVFPSELKEKVEKLLQMGVKNTAGVRARHVVTIPLISRQRVQNHNLQLILIQKIFLFSILLKQTKK